MVYGVFFSYNEKIFIFYHTPFTNCYELILSGVILVRMKMNQGLSLRRIGKELIRLLGTRKTRIRSWPLDITGGEIYFFFFLRST